MSLGLYIHFPFCTNLCHYCDFYKSRHDQDLEKQYIDTLIKEIDLAKNDIDPGRRKLDTIYIGGGTPSLINPDSLDRLINKINKSFSISSKLEFSFEINPESINVDKLNLLKGLGVNRPIFGIQSFNPQLLKILRRKHNLNDSFRAVYHARALGFENFGVDMIFGLPRQTGKKLSEDLQQLIQLLPPHISYYQLTVEPGTPLESKVMEGKIKMPSNELSAAMYHAINDELTEIGYSRYEVSSFAAPGFECRHNLKYWEGNEYLGLGPSAHSFIEERRFANTSDLKIYLEKINVGQRPLEYDSSRKEDRIIEAIMLGLRTNKGIAKDDFGRRFNSAVEEVIDKRYFRLMLKADLIEDKENFIRLTKSGFPVADEIISKLIG